MLPEIVFLIVGALLGALFDRLLPKTIEVFNEYKAQRDMVARQRLLASTAVSKWLLDYYERKGSTNDLYNCKIADFEVRLPYLTRVNWSQLQINLLQKHDLIVYAHGPTPEIKIDNKLIRLRSRLGQSLFNEPTLYIDRLEQGTDYPHLHVKACGYFQMFSLLAALEEETFKAVSKKEFRNTPLRDRMCPSLDIASRVPSKPVSIGCQVATVLRTAETYEIVLQTRSHKTVTSGGKKAVIPSFGLSPIIPDKGVADIIFYNFLKEYCEELFNYNELVTLSASKRVDPYWFYKLPEAQRILRLMQSGGLVLECLGFGFETLNGSLNLAVLALINDVATAGEIKHEIAANWEVAERSEILDEPIEFVDFRSPKLRAWLQENRYHISGAFALSRAIERLYQIHETSNEGMKSQS